MQLLRLSTVLIVLISSQNCHQKLNSPQSITEEIPVNIQIDQQQSGELGPCEPTIFINPKDSNHIIAGAILDRVYSSKDGGKTWVKSKLNSTYGVWGDPSLFIDQNGSAYYAHLSDPSGLNFAHPSILDRIVVQKSIDGGISWNNGSFAGDHHPKDQDKQWITGDPETNHLYLTWTEFDQYNSKNPKHHSRILFAKSTDQGESWSESIILSQFEGDCLDDDYTTEGAVPVTGPNGEIYVAWSFDEKIYFDRSMDGGSTWLAKDIKVTNQPGGWTFDVPGINRTNGLPVTGVDRSNGAHRGTVYINWSDQRNGTEDTDIWLSKSTDQGSTWSKPIRVNNDPPGKHNFLTWMSIDPISGNIYIVFYDRRAYDTNETDVYLAYSVDGGQTFTNKKISERSFTPQSSVFFGDYNNIHAYNGRIRPFGPGTRILD